MPQVSVDVLKAREVTVDHYTRSDSQYLPFPYTQIVDLWLIRPGKELFFVDRSPQRR